MKKTILVLAGVASMLASVPAAQAATVGGNFNVTVSLTSICTMASVTDLAFGTYTAFGSAVTATPTTATLTCTRGLIETGVLANFDTSGPIGSTGAAAATDAVGAGVLAGLQYDITATKGTITPGTAATASSIGTPASRPYVISGTMLGGQAGTATIGSAIQVRTLTITY
jgi:spore coat protein U-like protein